MKKTVLIKLLVLFMLCIITLFFVGCGSENSSDSVEYEGPISDSSETSITSITDNRKVYYTASYYVDTDDLNKDTSILKSLVAKYNGYIEVTDENKYSGSQNAYFRLRIPTEKLNQFMQEFENGSAYSQKNIKSTDITTSYVTTQARIEVLEASRDRYIAMLEDTSSTLTMNEIMLINDKIDDLNYELNALNKQMTQYNSLIEYSTVTVNYNKNYEENILEEASSNYGEYLLNFLRGLLIFLMYGLPFFVLIGCVIGVIILVKYLKKKKNSNNIYNRVSNKIE